MSIHQIIHIISKLISKRGYVSSFCIASSHPNGRNELGPYKSRNKLQIGQFIACDVGTPRLLSRIRVRCYSIGHWQLKFSNIL